MRFNYFWIVSHSLIIDELERTNKSKKETIRCQKIIIIY